MAYPNNPPTLRLLLTVYTVVASAWAVLVARFVAWDLRFEDAMIVLRYARNLISGEGFVFNPGEKVLGVTTPLHTLISTLYVGLGGDSAPVLQNLAGVAALALQGGLLLVLLVLLGRPWAALPAALCVLGSYNLSWLYFGMETHLFVALALAVLVLNLDPEKAEGRRTEGRTEGRTVARSVGLGALLGACFLLRYDAALLAALVGFDRWIRHRRFPWRMTLTFFLVVSPWLIFAQIYFGSILPEPLRAKQGYAGSSAYFETLYGYYRQTFERLLLAFSPSTRAAIYSSFALPLVLIWGAVSAVWSDRRMWLIATYPVLHVTVYAVLGSDPNFTWHHYLLNPFGFAWIVLAADDLVRRLLRAAWVQDRLDRVSWLAARPKLWAGALLALACLPLVLHLGRHAIRPYQPDPLTAQLHAMGDWLKQHYPPDTSFLQPAIGILGWRSGLRMVDHAGLITPGLYFYNDQECTPLAEVVEKHRPDLILHSPWAVGDPAELGYVEVHNFEQPFAYRVFELEDR